MSSLTIPPATSSPLQTRATFLSWPRHHTSCTKSTQRLPGITSNKNRLLFHGGNSRIPQARKAAQNFNPSHVSRETMVEEEGDEDYPMVRTFENDICRLFLVGEEDYEEAVSAAAADGGKAAVEHIASGRSIMVVESFYPTYSTPQSTASTKLHVSTSKVAERARNLYQSANMKMFQDKLSGEALAVAFHSVTMRQLSSFELSIFNSGTCRDMSNLTISTRQSELYATLTSSDEKLLAELADVLCSYFIASMKIGSCQEKHWKTSNYHRKKMPSTSLDSGVHIRPLVQSEMASYTKYSLENSNNTHQRMISKNNSINQWWPLPSWASSLSDKVGAKSEYTGNEHLPIHKLQINADFFKSTKFSGWQQQGKNTWEILLSHRQLVELTDVLDMYYKDPNTCPGKQLHTFVDLDAPLPIINKVTVSFWSVVLKLLIGGVALVSLAIVAKLSKYSLSRFGVFSSKKAAISSPIERVEENIRKPVFPYNKKLSPKEMEVACALVVEMAKNALEWPLDIQRRSGKGAWIGVDLIDWARTDKNLDKIFEMTSMTDGKRSFIMDGSEDFENVEGISSTNNTHYQDSIHEHQQASIQNVQDVAVFELTLSRNGVVVGFQPINRTAVNQWANNPISKALYHKKKLRPGFLEPGLGYRGPPKDPIVIELLMVDNSTSRSVTARLSST